MGNELIYILQMLSLVFVVLWKDVEKALKIDPIHRVSVLTFNVENLFDTNQNPLKNDFTFLPLHLKRSKKHLKHCLKIKVKKWRQECLFLDWSNQELNSKLFQIAKTIKSVNQGRGADVVFLQEIENLEVLKRLNDQHLTKLNYKAIFIEGQDPRGINTALLTRLKIHQNAKLLKIPNRGSRKTREILQTTLVLPDGRHLQTLGVHLPSAMAAPYIREEILDFINLWKTKNSGEMTLLAGDFNIHAKEEKKHSPLKRHMFSQWQMAHLIGCFYCSGTYGKGTKNRSFLDLVLLSKSPGTWRIWPASMKTIPNEASDHDAFYVELAPNPIKFRLSP